MYIIEHHFSYGWDVAGFYSIKGVEGRFVELFETRGEAAVEINEMIVAANENGMDYKRKDWRIRKVTDADPVIQTFAVRIQCGGRYCETLVRARSAREALQKVMDHGLSHGSEPTDAQRTAYIRSGDKCPLWRVEE
jgi:hypothetical protein